MLCVHKLLGFMVQTLPIIQVWLSVKESNKYTQTHDLSFVTRSSTAIVEETLVEDLGNICQVFCEEMMWYYSSVGPSSKLSAVVSVCARATTDFLVGQDFKRAVSHSSNWLLVDCSFKATFECLSVCMEAQSQFGQTDIIICSWRLYALTSSNNHSICDRIFIAVCLHVTEKDFSGTANKSRHKRHRQMW